MNFLRVFGLGVVISVAASAASAHKVELPAAMSVGGTKLEAGEYKVEVAGDKAKFSSGKKMVAEAAVTVENAARKYSNTKVSSSDSTLQSIAVGGTTMKIVLKK
ncbi:MAG: hypothetical protein ABI995_00255 [Acidobacteriota bacterium]